VQLLNEKNLAKQLDVSVAKLRKDRLENRGLDYTRIGRSVRYNLVSVLKSLKDNSVLQPRE
jgi:hypothetical protein